MGKASDEATQETKLDMTPMIDVTFQLIIFFMCSIKFKVLEGKLQTYLPKDVGVNPTPVDQLLEKVDIQIRRRITRKEMNLDDINVYRQWSDAGGFNMNHVEITYQGQPVASLAELGKQLKALREKTPRPTDPNEPDQLKMNLAPMAGVLYEDVVKVVDVALAAKFTDITFRGIESDA